MRVKACSIIDAPSDLGLRRTGVSDLPKALRAAGLLEGLRDARYAGTIHVPPYNSLRDPETGVLNPGSIVQFSRLLSQRISFTLALGRFPVVLGGDCSILIGSALALRRKGRYGLFFIDGHADFYSPESEPYGEIASMDLAIVTGRGPAALTDIAGLCPLVEDNCTVAFGIRDEEIAAQSGSPDIRQTGILIHDLEHIRKLGAAQAAREAVLWLEESGIEGFWIHLDADVLNDEVMPAVDYRMPDGLWPEELMQALTVALQSPLAMGLEVTIYNPTYDDPYHFAARTLATILIQVFSTLD